MRKIYILYVYPSAVVVSGLAIKKYDNIDKSLMYVPFLYYMCMIWYDVHMYKPTVYKFLFIKCIYSFYYAFLSILNLIDSAPFISRFAAKFKQLIGIHINICDIIGHRSVHLL